MERAKISEEGEKATPAVAKKFFVLCLFCNGSLCLYFSIFASYLWNLASESESRQDPTNQSSGDVTDKHASVLHLQIVR